MIQKLFNKVLSYTEGNLTSVVTTRISDNKTLTKNFGYSNGDLVNITSTAT